MECKLDQLNETLKNITAITCKLKLKIDETIDDSQLRADAKKIVDALEKRIAKDNYIEFMNNCLETRDIILEMSPHNSISNQKELLERINKVSSQIQFIGVTAVLPCKNSNSMRYYISWKI